MALGVSTLFGGLVLELLLAIAGQAGIAMCAACGEPYVPRRRLPAGRFGEPLAATARHARPSTRRRTRPPNAGATSTPTTLGSVGRGGRPRIPPRKGNLDRTVDPCGASSRLARAGRGSLQVSHRGPWGGRGRLDAVSVRPAPPFGAVGGGSLLHEPDAGQLVELAAVVADGHRAAVARDLELVGDHLGVCVRPVVAVDLDVA